MGKIIEFYGPPGSGKTTLANMAISYLNRNKIEAMNYKKSQYIGFKRWISEIDEESFKIKFLNKTFNYMPDRLGSSIYYQPLFYPRVKYERNLLSSFILQNPKTFNLEIEKINQMYPINIGERILNWFKEDFKKYQNVIKNLDDKKIVILDEAFLQRILASYSLLRTVKCPSNSDITELTECFVNKIDFAFFVSAQSKVCEKRQKNRGRVVKGFEEHINNNVDRIKDHRHRLKMSQLIHKTLKKEGVKSFNINNNSNLNDVKEELQKRLDKIIDHFEK